jgi:hypothetical protein
VANKQEEAINSRALDGLGLPPDLHAMHSRTSHLETVVLIRDIKSTGRYSSPVDLFVVGYKLILLLQYQRQWTRTPLWHLCATFVATSRSCVLWNMQTHNKACLGAVTSANVGRWLVPVCLPPSCC